MAHTGISVYHPVKLDREYLAGKALALFGKKHPDSWRESSAYRKTLLQEEFGDLIIALEQSLSIDNPVIFTDHITWSEIHFPALHFPKDHGARLLDTLGEVLKDELPSDFRKKADACITTGRAALKKPVDEIPGFITGDNPLAETARSFLDAVIAADQVRAWKILGDSIGSGTSIKDIYLRILEPVLQETGRLWQVGQIGIADEHAVTALVETLMARLHDRSFPSGETGKPLRGTTVVAAGAGPGLHAVGIRMVADFFLLDGWNTYYTGANIPARSILKAARDQKADVIALSTTLPRHLPDLQYLIRSLRADPETSGAKIIVGGYIFRLVPGLWKQVGADAFAGTAEEAVAVANRLVPRRD